MQSKINEYIDELESLQTKLADPSIYSSPEYPKLAKRQSFLENTIALIKQKKSLENQLAEVKKLAQGNDELAELAELEVS